VGVEEGVDEALAFEAEVQGDGVRDVVPEGEAEEEREGERVWEGEEEKVCEMEGEGVRVGSAGVPVALGVTVVRCTVEVARAGVLGESVGEGSAGEAVERRWSEGEAELVGVLPTTMPSSSKEFKEGVGGLVGVVAGE